MLLWLTYANMIREVLLGLLVAVMIEKDSQLERILRSYMFSKKFLNMTVSFVGSVWYLTNMAL